QLDQISPLVEPDATEQGCWYIDLTGLERHHGSFHDATGAILACVNPLLQPRAGLAPAPFTARVAAEVAKPGSIREVSASETTAFLSRAPITCLPLPADQVRQIARLGIPTLGAFTSIPA